MPDQSQWYLHIQGETVGPLPTETILVMLKQNRLQFADFAWEEGLTKWVRISDLDPFAALLPEYPKAPIPGRKSVTERKSVVKAKPVIQSDEPEDLQDKQEMAVPTALPQQKKASAPQAKEAPVKAIPQKRDWPKIRRFPRVPISANVQITDVGKFEATDVSEGGIFLKASQALPIGTEVKFTLECSAFDRVLEMTGLVIRLAIGSAEGFAIEFTRVNPAHRRILKQYIESQIDSIL